MSTRPLNEHEIDRLLPFIPREDLLRAVLHLGHVPWYLPKRFTAIVRGCHIYIRAGVYRDGCSVSMALLGHELVHVGQYRCGMTAFGYLCSALRGYRHSRDERQAHAVQARIFAALDSQPSSAATPPRAPARR